MAELNEVLGAILKDVAESRVKSDVFSREVSMEYLQDPILANFPVPRVEIKQASIQLRFAVNSVEQKSLDPRKLLGEKVQLTASKLANKVFEAVLMKASNREEVIALIKQKNIPIKEQLLQKAITILNNSLDNLIEDPDRQVAPLTKKLQSSLEELMRQHPDMWKLLTKSARVGEIRKAMTESLGDGVQAFAQQAKDAIAAAQQTQSIVDVAVTAEELANIPDTVLSEIGLVTEIRNYEWTDTIDADGNPIRRLQPE